MKIQIPIECNPKGMCGKCPPCLAMQKLCEKQQKIPAQCTSKRRKSPEVELIASIYAAKNSKRHRQNDGNSSDCDGKKTSAKEKAEGMIKREESNVTICSRKSNRVERNDSDESVCTVKSERAPKEMLKKYFDVEVADYANYTPRMCVQQKERPKSRELRAGISYIGCDCEKRNGLQDQCKRTECQGCPKCRQFPPTCYLSKYSNAKHLSKLKDAGIKSRCPYVDKKGNILIST